MSDCTTRSETMQNNITKTCDGLARLLVAKNQRYGNSALEPIRVFSRADPAEGILVRLDDKLSRIKYASNEGNLLRKKRHSRHDGIPCAVLRQAGMDGL